MTRFYIKKIEIEGFRGINNEGHPLKLKFKPDSVNSIYALNGLGKSSLFDALSYAIFGKIPKLSNLEQVEQSEEYINNRFHTSSTSNINLTFQSDDGTPNIQINIERDANGTRTATSPTHPDPEEFLKSLRSEFALLDQACFERFIHDRSLGRGRQFSRLIGLSRLTDCRSVFQQLANNGNLDSDFNTKVLEQQRASLTSNQQRLTLAIRKAFDTITGRPVVGTLDPASISANVIASLKQIPTLTDKCGTVDIQEINFDDLENAVSKAEKSEDRNRLASLRDARQKLKNMAAKDEEKQLLVCLRASINRREAVISSTGGPLLLKNYRTAKAVVEDGSWPNELKCPTCENVNDGSILELVSAKIKAYEEVDAANATIKADWEKSELRKRIKKLEANPTIAAKESTLCDDFEEAVREESLSMKLIEDFTTRLDELDRLRIEKIGELDAKIKELESKLPSSMVAVTRQLATAKQLKADLAEYIELQPNLEKVASQLDRRREWKEFIQSASSEFAAAESKWVKNRQSAINGQYQDMHEAITRNRDVVPNLDRPDGSERLQLRLSNFYGLADLSANTLLQESYCNSLAISIFLSSALTSPSKARFIVFDDITSSFDGGHQFQLMELIRTKICPANNSSGLQIILLTHDTMLEKYLAKATQKADWNHQKLMGNPPNGPVLTEQHDAQRIRHRATDFLSTGQTDAAHPWIRQYLELVVLQLIRKVGISVPLDFAMDDNKKMVQNALDAIAKDVDLHQTSSTLILDAMQVSQLSNTLVPALISNYCAHYNTAAFAGLTKHVLNGVLDDIDALAECFKYDCTCLNAGSTTKRFYRNLRTKRCSC